MLRMLLTETVSVLDPILTIRRRMSSRIDVYAIEVHVCTIHCVD